MNSNCYRCTFFDRKMDTSCPACRGGNYIQGIVFKCFCCDGEGIEYQFSGRQGNSAKCHVCNGLGYYNQNFNKCVYCNAKGAIVSFMGAPSLFCNNCNGKGAIFRNDQIGHEPPKGSSIQPMIQQMTIGPTQQPLQYLQQQSSNYLQQSQLQQPQMHYIQQSQQQPQYNQQYYPQPQPGMYQPQPQTGMYQPQVQPGMYQRQPQPGIYQPQVQPIMYQPQPIIIANNNLALLHPHSFIQSQINGCSTCNQVGMSFGYKCTSCPDFILCNQCYSALLNENAKYSIHHHSINPTIRSCWKCNMCKNSYKNKHSYYCQTCDFDCCLRCLFA